MNRLKTIGTWLLGIVMLGMAFWAFRLWMASRIIKADPTMEGYTRALSWNPRSDEYHAILGDGYRNLLEGYDLDAAVRELKRAIELRPRVWTYHATLAATLEMKGDYAGAEASFRNAQKLNPRNATLHWLAANYFLRRSEPDKAMKAFRAAVDLDPGRLAFAADRMHATGTTVEEIGEKLVPGNRSGLLFYLYFVLTQLQDEPAKADTLSWQTWKRWTEAPAVGSFRLNSLFRYIQRLVRQGELDKALEVWRTGLREAGLGESGASIVFNGGFETEPLGGGFGWVMPKIEGVYYEYDRANHFRGGATLQISFAGESNPAFRGPRQTVILPAGTYELAYVIKSDGITSDQGIYITLRSIADGGLLVESEKVKGTREWERMKYKFKTEVPIAAEIEVVRDKSRKFDNLLKGKVWIDEVEINALN